MVSSQFLLVKVFLLRLFCNCKLKLSLCMPWRYMGAWRYCLSHFTLSKRDPGTHWIGCRVGPWQRLDLRLFLLLCPLYMYLSVCVTNLLHCGYQTSLPRDKKGREWSSTFTCIWQWDWEFMELYLHRSVCLYCMIFMSCNLAARRVDSSSNTSVLYFEGLWCESWLGTDYPHFVSFVVVLGPSK